jgi:signal transduction histidine kinase
VGAIREFAAGFSRRSGIQVAVDLGTGVVRFAPEVELALLRIVQESLGNVLRHSGSATATIRLQLAGDRITLEVADAGSGFGPLDAEAGGGGGGQAGVGIAGMRERLRHLGGVLEILSGPGGTTVRATLPFTDARPTSPN